MDALPEGAALDGNVLQWTPSADTVNAMEESIKFTFKVSVSDGELSDSAEVELTVTHVDQMASVVVTADPQSLLVKTTSKITVTLKDSDGNPVTDEVVTLQADAGSVTSPATHVGDGKYAAEYTAGAAPGTVNVTAKTSSGKSGETTLTMTESEIAKLFISQPPPEIHAGETHQFTVSGEEANGNPVNVRNNEVSWEIIGGIGSINENGLFTAEKVGNSKVKATWKDDSQITAETELFSVITGQAAQLTLKATPDTLSPCEQAEITAIIVDACGNPVVDERISVLVQPHNAGEVGEVTNEGDGVYTGMYNPPLTLGDVTITFTTSNGISGEVVLSITEPTEGLKQLILKPDRKTAGAKDTIAVHIYVACAQGIAGGDITVTYDKNLFSFVKSKPGDFSGMSYTENHKIPGKISLEITMLKSISGGSGSLLDLIFNVREVIPPLYFGTSVLAMGFHS